MNIFTHIRARLRHRRARSMTREALEAERLKRFRALVVYASENSPYYAALIIGSGIDPANCTPEDFPVLTKKEVIKNFDRIVTDRSITKEKIEHFLSTSKEPLDLFDGRYYVLHTSGSSGEIGIYPYSQSDMARGLAKTPSPPWSGLRKTRLAFFGATKGHFAGVTFASIFKSSVLRFLFRMETYEINSPIDSVVEGLNRFKPDVVAGYATALKILADKKRQGALRIAPRLLMSSGEPLNADDRAVIESTFGAPLINSYMCTEHVYMGLGTPEYKGLYLFEDDLIFELHDDHTCVTNLFNYTLPLIRYKMDDVLQPIEDTDHLYPFTKIKEVVGRSEYIPYFTNEGGAEDFISPHIINEFFVRNLQRFQMVVVDKKSFIFKVIIDSSLESAARAVTIEEIEARLKEILSEKGLGNVTFGIERVDDLPVDKKTGKFKLIIAPV
ncbi:MAG: phenylacetate--CoA ligase family protein [Proteobacteria bacterium]|nr:phenylacetate--CoA ligase family protein [Pseudomonadota bacterium]